MTYEQFGWKHDDKAFLLGNTLYSAGSEEQVGGNQDLAVRSKWVGPTPDGSLEAWREAANALFAKDCEAQGATVLAGFASVLMKFLSSTEGGSIWSLWTPDSGTGKTTAAVAAVSIWGHPRGLETKTEFSKVVRGLTMAACGNLPVINDELRARDPVLTRDWVLWFSGGGDKPRGTRDGSIRHQEATWQTILITTDNYSLVEVLAQDSEVEDAAQMRVIELPSKIPPGRRHIYGANLKEQLIANAGHAGATYVRWLVAEGNLEWTKQRLEAALAWVYKTTDWDERYRFWARTVAACVVAGKIVTDLGIVDFSWQRIVEWLIAKLQERAKPKLNDWEIPLLSTYLDQHAHERLIVKGLGFKGPQGNAKAWDEPKSGRLSIRLEQDTGVYVVAITRLRQWLRDDHNRSYKEFVEGLKKNGIVINEKAFRTLGAGTTLASGQTWCIIIDGRHPAMSGLPRLVALDDAMDDDAPHQQSAP